MTDVKVIRDSFNDMIGMRLNDRKNYCYIEFLNSRNGSRLDMELDKDSLDNFIDILCELWEEMN